MYDIASKLDFLPLPFTRKKEAKRFDNAGLEFKSFLLNSSDIIFLFFLTFLNQMILSLFRLMLSFNTKSVKFLSSSIRKFKFGNYLELF